LTQNLGGRTFDREQVLWGVITVLNVNRSRNDLSKCAALLQSCSYLLKQSY